MSTHPKTNGDKSAASAAPVPAPAPVPAADPSSLPTLEQFEDVDGPLSKEQRRQLTFLAEKLAIEGESVELLNKRHFAAAMKHRDNKLPEMESMHMAEGRVIRERAKAIKVEQGVVKRLLDRDALSG